LLDFVDGVILSKFFTQKQWSYFKCFKSKKYRYQTIKQKEQSKLKIQKTRLSREIRRHMTGQHLNIILTCIMSIQHPRVKHDHLLNWRRYWYELAWYELD